ncbi:MAG: bifunctional riboflavin kinase/FAD synthetase [Cyclobacteriaceae bacterium]
MKVIDHLSDFDKPSFSAVTIGTFDGVHKGHQTIIEQVVTEAREKKGASVLITFWPHPRFVLNKDTGSLQLLSTFEEKLSILESLGLDYVIKIPFTPEFSNLSAEAFIKEILVDAIGVKSLYIGYDHRFGNNREGDINFLKKKSKEYHFELNEIPRQDIDSIGVSSTKIRTALNNGEVQFANSLLNRSYSISGKVIKGEKVGRTIGFPTANILIAESYKLLPGDGAYAVRVFIDGKQHLGMLNIGFKPTLDGSKRTIEVHVFNFEKDIYNKELVIEFVRLLRKEIKFNSLEDLKSQLKLDKEQAMNILL